MTLVLGLGPPELIILTVLLLVLVLVPLFGVYWLIRLAARHGAKDAQLKAGARAPRPPA